MQMASQLPQCDWCLLAWIVECDDLELHSDRMAHETRLTACSVSHGVMDHGRKAGLPIGKGANRVLACQPAGAE